MRESIGAYLKQLWTARLSDRTAWYEAVAAASLNVGGMPMEWLIGWNIPGMPRWPAGLSVLIGVVSLLILFLRRERAGFPLTGAIFLANTMAVAAGFLLTNPYYAMGAHIWVPFQGSKLATLIAVLIAPSFVLGLAGVAIHSGLSALQWLTFDSELKTKVAFGEPWAVLAIGIAAALTLCYRFSRVAAENRTAAAQAEAEAMGKLAVTLLSLRDLMNTPLQTLEFGIGVLREGKIKDGALFSQMERAVDQLKTTNAMLKKYDARINEEQYPASPPKFKV